ncbi:MAG TPA: DNA polymerase III subunit alpha [Bacteroidia bacterium]|nr:DNA polymerase III subunit alpha [Bacteroidia bacterium]
MFLNCHSYYSLRYGTLPVERLVELGKQHGAEALCLTDINNVTGVFDFVKECRAQGIKPIAGVEVRNGDTHLYTLIAQNNHGFAEINEFMTGYNLRHADYPLRPYGFNYVHVIYTLDTYESWLGTGHKGTYTSTVNNEPMRTPLPGTDGGMAATMRIVRAVEAPAESTDRGPKLRDYEWIGVRISRINRLVRADSSVYNKCVVMQPITYTDEHEYDIHCLLRAVEHNTLVTKLEAHHVAPRDEHFTNVDHIRSVYAQYPQLLHNTEKLMDTCSFDFDYGTIKNRSTFTGNRYDDKLLLEKLLLDGLEYRYGKNNREARRRVYSELDVIDKLGFTSYFLITWDTIRYSMSRGFYHVGRGSGANSIAAYCLRITDVDPIELDLYFERFINAARTSPPDFDIDYSWRDRDAVIDYIFKRYGSKHTALMGTISTFKGRSILRELGKVFGMPKGEIDVLVNKPLDAANDTMLCKRIINYGNSIADFPNQRSIHSGGVLISDLPIFHYTALDLPPKDFAVTQFDMYVAESIGFEKLDILSQRGIGHIQDSVKIIEQNRKVRVDVHDVKTFKTDEKVNAQLRKGDAIGCFYVESPAMRGLLKKLRCGDYITLVAASSIIRPGVAKSGMMRAYIQRFHKPESVVYLHPVMEELLKETYGVMVYQEDVIKVAHHFAGLDLTEADVLRRAMSGKFRSRKELDKIVEKFFANCRERGYNDELSKEVWRQIESFSGYSFSKAHSASYAVESYQSLFLKTYFPMEFMVAVINNFGGFYRTWVYVHEARMAGAQIECPCVNTSTYLTSIKGRIIYLGFIHIENMEQQYAERIAVERNRGGAFTSLEDFVLRIHISLDQVMLLIRLGAFRFTGIGKKELLWQAHLLLNKGKVTMETMPMFIPETKTYPLPTLEHHRLDDAYEETELLGFPVTCTRFDLLKTNFRGDISAAAMPQHIGKKVRLVGDLVAIKHVTTVKREYMNFATMIDAEGNFFDTVHFPDQLKNHPFNGYGIYMLLGKVVEEFGFCMIEVEKMAKMELQADPRYAG